MTSSEDDARQIENRARDLCAAEGWDPDEIIDCEPDEVAGARLDGVSGQWRCQRWQAYARAAERAPAADDWDVF